MDLVTTRYDACRCCLRFGLPLRDIVTMVDEVSIAITVISITCLLINLRGRVRVAERRRGQFFFSPFFNFSEWKKTLRDPRRPTDDLSKVKALITTLSICRQLYIRFTHPFRNLSEIAAETFPQRWNIAYMTAHTRYLVTVDLISSPSAISILIRRIEQFRS